MTLDQWAQLSNYLTGSAFAVLCIAFFCHVAEWVSARRQAPVAVAAGASEGAVATADADDEPETPDRLVGIAVSLTVLGTLLLIGGSVTRALATQRAPFGNMYEFGVTGTAIALTVYLIMVWRSRIQWMGGVVLGVSLFILGMSISSYTPAGPLVPALNTFWKYIHVSSIMVAAAMFMVGAAASVLYLVKVRAEERGKVGPVLARFPTSARIDQVAFRMNAIGFPMWTFGALISGPIWAHLAWGRYWGWDPKEVWALITWIVYAGYLHARVTAGWKGKRAAYLALIGFVTFIISYYVVNLFVSGQHSYA
ncbi:c-type cytochrome biogenesis protein CcsB [Aeromicrobium tamlense]|uniref:C-type cytochrome biogenesis protein CcsB n=1 Tax=Aeromicrobium tamlense TaxID=375541 RepID=A0A8I0FSR5_9ACTN|nr:MULTISPECIES: c-type cytochrome biogenesis protein CcsB [Aeromicrobium]MBD1269370.1 c-type cytochrome biogenesis protein CcsB [Aeromicrobium tamlense]NYI36722.1 cytochrome c-type biogenesis protein CcsB [Aeromicrobium tamlense]